MAESPPTPGSSPGKTWVLAAATFIVLVLLLVAIIPTVLNFRIRQTGDELTRDIFPLRTTNNAIAEAMVDQESGQRGYILTGDPTFLQPYDAARAQLDGLWQQGQAQAARVSQQARDLLSAESDAARRWQTDAGEPEIELVRSGQPAAAARDVASGNGRTLFDAYRSLSTSMNNYLDEEERQKTARRSELVQTLVVTQVVLAVLAGAGVATLHYIVRLTQRNTLRLVQAEADRRMREEFLSAVSHDLRTPLTTIKGMVQLGGRQAGRMRTPEAALLVESMDTADAAVDRMDRMIDQLLDLARLQQGQALAIESAAVDLVQLAQQIAVEQQQTAVHHRILVESAAPSLIGYWDRGRLARVLGNLLSNAVKYSPDGGDVIVTIAGEEREGLAWASLSVRDHGLGIPLADLPHLFNRFHRGRNVRDRIAGVGIGLAGARQIVEQHGGSLLVESKEGHGATFTVRLPLQAPGDRKDKPQPGKAASSIG